MNLVRLGTTDIQVTELGIGVWSWGDKFSWGYGNGYDENDVHAAMDAIAASEVNFLDTAEIYGFGESERLLGKYIDGARNRMIVATKFFPLPWRWRKKNLIDALRRSLHRLQMQAVDLYQVHQPLPPISPETWMAAMAEAVQVGLVRAVGVSNYNADWTRRACNALAKFNLPLASNQLKYSLLDRRIEFNGTMQTCRDLNITIIAYSPIEMGVLSGKYTPDNPPPGLRSRRYQRDYLARVQPLIGLLREIGQAHGGKTPAQVAINWTICKGTVPIPGAKNAVQAQENIGAAGWRLTPAEIAAMEQAAERVKA
jgi:aryl-alcohol dehydrogenase-like predicted oxidoreductase